MFIRRLLPAWIQPASSAQTSPPQEPPLSVSPGLHETETADGMLIDREAQGGTVNSGEIKADDLSQAASKVSSPRTDPSTLALKEETGPSITISTPGLTLTSSLALKIEAEEESDQDTTPLLASSTRPQTPPVSSYQQYSNYSYFTGIACGTLWGGLGATFKNLPVIFQLSGATLFGVISVELLLTQAHSYYPTLNKEQARKKMLFNDVGAALATNSLQLIIGGTTGLWAVPLIMLGAKALAPTVEAQLTRVMPQLAANLSSWWNRRCNNGGESKKFDLDNGEQQRFSFHI